MRSNNNISNSTFDITFIATNGSDLMCLTFLNAQQRIFKNINERFGYL